MIDNNAEENRTGTHCLWHDHRVKLEDGVVLDIRVDIALQFNELIFVKFKHLLVFKSPKRLSERDFFSVFEQVCSINKVDERYVFAGTCRYDNNTNWYVYSDDELFRYVEKSTSSALVAIAEDCFTTENDGGECFRGLLLPSPLANLFREIKECVSELVEEGISSQNEVVVYHYIKPFNDSTRNECLKQLDLLGFVLNRQDGDGLWFSEHGRLAISDRERSAALIFHAVDDRLGTYDQWEIDLRGKPI